MLPDFIKVKRLIKKNHDEFFRDAIRYHSGDFFSEISHKAIHEGETLLHKYSNDLSHQTPLHKIETSFNITIDELLNNPFITFQKLFESAKEFADQQAKMMIQTITEVTEMSGNVVKGSKGIISEDILEMYQKIEIPFDANDNPLLPTIMAGPEMVKRIQEALKEEEENEEFKKKLDQIIETKRKSWNDRENNRKLVD